MVVLNQSGKKENNLVALPKQKGRAAAAREYLNDFATLLYFVQSEVAEEF